MEDIVCYMGDIGAALACGVLAGCWLCAPAGCMVTCHNHQLLKCALSSMRDLRSCRQVLARKSSTLSESEIQTMLQTSFLLYLVRRYPLGAGLTDRIELELEHGNESKPPQSSGCEHPAHSCHRSQSYICGVNPPNAEVSHAGPVPPGLG